MEKYGKMTFVIVVKVIVMMNFIICEDESVLQKKYKEEIEKFMMNYDIDYECYCFNEYNKDFKNLAKKEIGFKIYLLDIVTNKGSGLDAARLIREEYDDWTSMIIVITSYNEYKYEALGKRLMLVDFINKLDNCEKKLKDAFSICMKNYDKRYNSLKYIYKGTAHNIELRKIVYIEKEPDSKVCSIHTIDGEYKISGSLNSILKKLDKRFYKCHRSAIVNIEQIESYNMKENKVRFKNKVEIDMVSRDKKKELLNRVRGVF